MIRITTSTSMSVKPRSSRIRMRRIRAMWHVLGLLGPCAALLRGEPFPGWLWSAPGASHRRHARSCLSLDPSAGRFWHARRATRRPGSRPTMRTCVRSWSSASCFPASRLVAALGDRRELLGGPVALAPEAGRQQVVGEVSAAAEAHGVDGGDAGRRGARALPGDPPGAARSRRRARRCGARCSTGSSGSARTSSRTARGRRTSRPTGCTASTAATSTGCCAPTRRALDRPGARIGAAPAGSPRGRRRWRRGRGGAASGAAPALPFGAVASGSAVVVPAGSVRAFLAPLPVALLRARPELEELPETLERLGVRTLGELAALPLVGDGRSGSGTRGCWRSTWPRGATRGSSRASRPSRWPSGWRCPRRRRACSSSGRSSC